MTTGDTLVSESPREGLRLSFSYEVKDLQRMRKLLRRRGVADLAFFWVSRVVIGILLVPIVIGLTVAPIIGLVQRVRSGAPLPGNEQIIVTVPAIIWLAVAVLAGLRVIGRRLRNRRMRRNILQVELTARGIVWHQGFTHALIEWGAYQRLEETADYFMLWSGPRQCMMLPRRGFTQEENRALEEILHRHVQRTHGFPVG
jgi:hypothetical protein